jgi:hypothetical protein
MRFLFSRVLSSRKRRPAHKQYISCGCFFLPRETLLFLQCSSSLSSWEKIRLFFSPVAPLPLHISKTLLLLKEIQPLPFVGVFGLSRIELLDACTVRGSLHPYIKVSSSFEAAIYFSRLLGAFAYYSNRGAIHLEAAFLYLFYEHVCT